LDHGFIRVVDYMGNDNAIVQAARVSYGRGTKRLHEDRGLIHYLMRHRHSTPFEMCEIKLHIKLPLFVARQWIRHRTANVNEISARYSVLSREFYIPEPEHLGAQSRNNRQGRSEALLPEKDIEAILERLTRHAETSYQDYAALLNDPAEEGYDENRPSLARELARMVLPLNYYTEWYWKIDLHNLMHFCSLRADPHAQYEIRVYADALVDILKDWVPLTYEAFERYRLGSKSLSSVGLALVRARMRGEEIDYRAAGLSQREWQELLETIPELEA
jgi:thymidylate synthase (FAD)